MAFLISKFGKRTQIEAYVVSTWLKRRKCTQLGCSALYWTLSSVNLLSEPPSNPNSSGIRAFGSSGLNEGRLNVESVMEICLKLLKKGQMLMVEPQNKRPKVPKLFG